MQFELLQGCVVERIGAESGFDEFGSFRRSIVVRVDTIADGVLYALPITFFKELFSSLAILAKQSIVTVEALDHRFSNEQGRGVFVEKVYHLGWP